MAVNPLTLLDGTTAYAADVEAKVNPLYVDIDNTNIAAAAGILWSKSEALPQNYILLGNVANVATPTPFSGLPEIAPIGVILAFYDFAGALTFDATKWAYCNGQAINVGGIGVQTLPDISNRYMVGYGTEGGADIGTAAWAVPPANIVGNASHQINLQHAHIMSGHVHGMNSHTHTTDIGSFSTGNASSDHTHNMNGHVHDTTPHVHQIGEITNATGGVSTAFYIGMAGGQVVNWTSYLTGGTGTKAISSAWSGVGGILSGGGSGNTNAASPASTLGQSVTHNHTVDPAATASGGPSVADTLSKTDTMNNQLSTTQSIQPRSIKVRFIMRVA